MVSNSVRSKPIRGGCTLIQLINFKLFVVLRTDLEERKAEYKITECYGYSILN